MHVAKINVQGNSLVGLYILPLDTAVLIGPEVAQKDRNTLEAIFKVPIIQVTIAGTGLLGVFAATNGKTLVVPSIIFPHEENALKEAGIMYTKIKTNLTCLGNNIVASKKGVLLNPGFEDSALEELQDAFTLPFKVYSLGDMPTIGSFLACNSTHGLCSHEFSDEKISEMENHLGVKITTGTVNLGSTQIHSGLAVSDAGFVIGDISGGPEIINADEALGFLGDD